MITGIKNLKNLSIPQKLPFSSQVRWSSRITKNISTGRLIFGAAGSTVNDVTRAFNEIFLRIPQITPSVHIEPQLLKQITSDMQARASTILLLVVLRPL